MKKKLVVLSGAGISAESGIKTFRDTNGLWENHSLEEVASPEGFAKNPELVLEFYNQRRQQLKSVKPNRAHEILAELQDFFDVKIITQNVDNLHERAGSNFVLHLHGELLKARPINDENIILNWENDIKIGDMYNGAQLRPHIVWFGEMVPEMETAKEIASLADYFLVIGTSLQVYPAAGLLNYIPNYSTLFVVDPNLPSSYTQPENYYPMNATEGMEILQKRLITDFL